MPEDPTVNVAHRFPAVAQLAAVQKAVAGLPEPELLTQEKYEEKRSRLQAKAEEARIELNRARSRYEQITGELRDLLIEWRQQQTADRTAEK